MFELLYVYNNLVETEINVKTPTTQVHKRISVSVTDRGETRVNTDTGFSFTEAIIHHGVMTLSVCCNFSKRHSDSWNKVPPGSRHNINTVLRKSTIIGVK